jgi:hypothetical protein
MSPTEPFRSSSTVKNDDHSLLNDHAAEPIPVVPDHDVSEVEQESSSGESREDTPVLEKKHPPFTLALVAASYPIILIVSITIAAYVMYTFML